MNDETKLSQSPTSYQRVPDLTRITEKSNIPTDAFMLLSSTSTDYAVQFSLLMDLIMPVGACMPWHTATPPEGWVIYDGRQFDINANPKNALIFPSGRFPDYSGRVPEGYIDDTNGAVGSVQTGGVKSHGHSASSSFTGTAKAPTASFTGSALPGHRHLIGNSNQPDGAGTEVSPDLTLQTNGWNGHQSSAFLHGVTGEANVFHTTNVSAGTPSGTVTVNSYTPQGTISTSVTASGSSRNTVDRVVCYWIGRLG